ncbi:HESP132 [Hemileuca sp. nucleopolyhedrovirus]|uniref:HESP132 n=1 Tax=Hemileuca sp. nucleopolyhedrovirus TaxID=1367203 RepID=S5MQL1_9ABAC|nr:HESP132 [Hemileuca sp. nucleopolyhedrovirus]AGR56884.1 HESP132 [Hemileuca sp. nucleopolyhedrovirus]
MSTLRNKILVKHLQERARLCYFSRKGEPRQFNDEGLQVVSVEKLKKISKAFLILKESHKKLSECVKSLSRYYERQYEVRLQRLRLLLGKKTRKLQRLKTKFNNDNNRFKYIIIVRRENELTFYTNVNCIKTNNFTIVVYKISDDPTVDRSVCVSVAKTKYGDRANVFQGTISFDRAEDADSFVSDIKQMFNV